MIMAQAAENYTLRHYQLRKIRNWASTSPVGNQGYSAKYKAHSISITI